MILEKALSIYNKLPVAQAYPADQYVPYHGGFIIVGKALAPNTSGCNTFWIKSDGTVSALVPGILLTMEDKPDFSKLKKV